MSAAMLIAEAATKPGAEGFANVVIAGAALIAAIVVAWFGIAWWRKAAITPVQEDTGFSFAQIREMRDRGEISEDEYQTMRGKLVARFKKADNFQAAPPVKPEPPKPPPPAKTPTVKLSIVPPPSPDGGSGKIIVPFSEAAETGALPPGMPGHVQTVEPPPAEHKSEPAAPAVEKPVAPVSPPVAGGSAPDAPGSPENVVAPVAPAAPVEKPVAPVSPPAAGGSAPDAPGSPENAVAPVAPPPEAPAPTLEPPPPPPPPPDPPPPPPSDPA